jgi:hypothetical protein
MGELGMPTSEVANEIGALVEARRELLRDLAKGSKHLVMDALAAQLVSASEVLEWFGAEPVFDMRVSVAGGGWYMPEAVTWAEAVVSGLGGVDEARMGRATASLRELGEFARKAALPWLPDQDARQFCPTPWERTGDTDGRQRIELGDDQRLGLFAIVATVLEKRARTPGRAPARAELVDAGAPTWTEMAQLLFPEQAPHADGTTVPTFRVAEQDQALVGRWRDGEVRFVAGFVGEDDAGEPTTGATST